MIKLSERLQTIADRTEGSEAMADIGTDHGFLPIYMLQDGRCSKAVVSDISGPSLQKAVENGRMYLGDTEYFEARQGSGLETVARGEVDTVVIAGMGGKLIRDIVSDDIEHTVSFRRFVFQPRNGQGHLRKWLCDNGFRIINEDVVVEGDNLPEIITVISPGHDTDAVSMSTRHMKHMKHFTGDDIQYRIPPWIIDAGGPVSDFLHMNLDREKRILKNVMMSKSRRIDQEEHICSNIYYIKSLIKEIENGKEK